MLVQQIVGSRTFLKSLTLLALGNSFISSTRCSFLPDEGKSPKRLLLVLINSKVSLRYLAVLVVHVVHNFNSQEGSFWQFAKCFLPPWKVHCRKEVFMSDVVGIIRVLHLLYAVCLGIGLTFNLWNLSNHYINSLYCLESPLDCPDQSCKGRFLLTGARYFICVRSSTLVLWFQIHPSFKSSYTMKYIPVRSSWLKHTFRI